MRLPVSLPPVEECQWSSFRTNRRRGRVVLVGVLEDPCVRRGERIPILLQSVSGKAGLFQSSSRLRRTLWPQSSFGYVIGCQSR